MAVVKSVPEAAELIGEYMDAGFGGFTFNNTIYSTPESIARAGELIKTVKGSRVAAPISG
jgi:hypothetical protein